LNDAELLMLTKVALKHWSIRERSCSDFFDTCEQEFLIALGRHFATSRKKIQDLIKQYRAQFKAAGSGTGINSEETQMVQVMKDLVAASDSESQRHKEKDQHDADREQDRLKAVRDRENMLMCAMDKQRAPGLPNLSSDEDSDEADKTSEDEEPAIPPSPSQRTPSQSTLSSRGGHGRSRNNAQGKKRARGSEGLDLLLAGIEAERALRHKELQRQIERDREDRDERERLRREEVEERERLRRQDIEERDRLRREEIEDRRMEREERRLAAMEERRVHLEVMKQIVSMFAEVRRP
jgi:uncharacterized membrane-anchored protein YhcB (DUF1043 family)